MRRGEVFTDESTLIDAELLVDLAFEERVVVHHTTSPEQNFEEDGEKTKARLGVGDKSLGPNPICGGPRPETWSREVGRL